MEKLKKVIEQYGRWTELSLYTGRIESSISTDFSHALENVKALLETIGKEICSNKDIALESTASFSSIIKRAFSAIGYAGDGYVTQISTSLANICQQIGELRNDIGPTSHGRSLDELRERNNKIDELTKDFLIDSTVIVACFLIRTFENENSRVAVPIETKMLFSEQEDFNNLWDETYGDFEMGEYSYPASEILYNVDYPAYVTEQKAYTENEEGDK
jgi:hypothetical protein